MRALCTQEGPAQVLLSDPVDRTVRSVVVRCALVACVPDLSDPFILNRPDCPVHCAFARFGVFALCVDRTVRPSGPDCPTYSVWVLSASLRLSSWRFEGGLFVVCFRCVLVRCVVSQWPTPT